MARTVKVGVIGTGAIGLLHMKGCNSSADGEIVAGADVDKKRLRSAAKEHGFSMMFEDYRDMLACPDVDAVTVALPNYLHAGVCIEALKAGKHVLCEKPFAMNVKEAKQVVDTAKKSRKTFMVGMNFRFNPDVQKVKMFTERGDLGNVYHARAHWMRRAGIPRIGSWFTQKKYSGGGGMLDIGVHLLDATLHLMGSFKPRAVSGCAFSHFGSRGMGDGSWGLSEINKKAKFDVDDHATAYIKLAGGRSLMLEISWALFSEDANQRGIDLYGTEGGASLFPAKVFKKTRNDYETIVPDGVKLPLPADRMHHFVDCIVGRKKPVCTAAQALAVQKILDAIYESSKTGKEVRIK